MAAADVAYLCDAANRYFRERVEPSDVIRTVSGANLVVSPQAARRMGWRDGLRCAARQGAAVDDVRRRYHDRAAARGAGGVAAYAVLSDVAALDRDSAAARRRFRLGAFRREVERARERWRFLGEGEAQRLVGAYGSRLAAVLGEARERADLGPSFGPELTGAEVRYLMASANGRAFPTTFCGGARNSA